MEKIIWLVDADDLTSAFDTREKAINYFKTEAKRWKWTYFKKDGYHDYGWIEYTCKREDIKPFTIPIYPIPYIFD